MDWLFSQDINTGYLYNCHYDAYVAYHMAVTTLHEQRELLLRLEHRIKQYNDNPPEGLTQKIANLRDKAIAMTLKSLNQAAESILHLAEKDPHLKGQTPMSQYCSAGSPITAK